MNTYQKEILSKFKTIETNGAFFITFEGIEGSGKSTQIKLFQNGLIEAGYDVLLLREPGGTLFGESLRDAILSSKLPIEPLSEALLMASSRAQLLREKIIPHLEKKNSIVICDRYIDSSIAYQGVARGLGIENVLKIHTFPPLCNLSHLTFYLKIDLELSMLRQEQRGKGKDYFESKGEQFYKNLIEGYEEAASIFPNRIKKIDGANSVDVVQKSIWSEWNKLLK